MSHPLELGIHGAASAGERIRVDDLTDAGVVLTMVIVVFTARIVCEQTRVAWVHDVRTKMELSASQFGLDLIGVFCVILGALWTRAVLVLSITRSRRVSPTNRRLIALIIFCIGLWSVPYEQWKLLIIRVHGVQHARKTWIISASAAGEIHLVDYLLAHGVDANTRAEYGESPLGAAAAVGQMEVAQLLIVRGARLDDRTLVTLN